MEKYPLLFPDRRVKKVWGWRRLTSSSLRGTSAMERTDTLDTHPHTHSDWNLETGDCRVPTRKERERERLALSSPPFTPLMDVVRVVQMAADMTIQLGSADRYKAEKEERKPSRGGWSP